MELNRHLDNRSVVVKCEGKSAWHVDVDVDVESGK